MSATPVRWGFLRSAWKQISSSLVLLALGSIAVWGHVTHWNLGGHAHAAAHGDEHEAQTDAHVAAGSAAADEAGPATPADLAALPQATPGAPAQVRFESAEAVRRSGIQTIVVEPQVLDEFVEGVGVVGYDQTRRAQLSCRVAGVVWRVEVYLGEPVAKDTVLAIIDSSDVGRLKSELLQALAQVEVRTQIRKSLDESVSAANHIRRVELELREAKTSLYNAQQNLANLGLRIHAEELLPLNEEQRARRLRFLGLPDSMVGGLDPELTTANLIPITAPFDGVVIGHEITIGEIVAPDKAQMEIADTRQMWITMDVHQEHAIRLALGQELSFATDGAPIEVHSEISWISTEVDERTRTVAVRAVVENPLMEGSDPRFAAQRLLRANTFGRGRVRVREQPDSIVVPNQAVQWDEGRYLVFVKMADDLFEARPVKLGTVTDTTSEIIAGLDPGAVVATVGSHVLKSEIQKLRTTQDSD
ncbi:MAG: efflux RND transporter periplasmic adaptor subunit [Pirellulales bacterium]|nr:efflux RND transporter periplasmic adaptor subunit [Pirellulales bacterium]